MVLLTVVAEGVLKVQAPPATTLLTSTTFPNPSSLSFHRVFATEVFSTSETALQIWDTGIEVGYSASVFCMLSDFALLDLFSERGAVAGTVASRTADLLGAFGHGGMFFVVLTMRELFLYVT